MFRNADRYGRQTTFKIPTVKQMQHGALRLIGRSFRTQNQIEPPSSIVVSFDAMNSEISGMAERTCRGSSRSRCNPAGRGLSFV